MGRRLSGWGITTIALAALLVPAAAVAAPGDLDPSFGNGGRAEYHLGFGNTPISEGLAVAAQADGKPVLAGVAGDGGGVFHFLVARAFANGALDGAFGSGGSHQDAIDQDGSAAHDVALAPDGSVVIAGYSHPSFPVKDPAIEQLTPAGSPDASFGSSGVAKPNLGGSGGDVMAVAVQPDGRIVGAADSGNEIAVFRLTTGGGLDPSFGNGGIRQLQLGSSVTDASDLLLQPDGHVLVAADINNTDGTNAMALVRLRPDGSVDSAFGTGGVARPDFGANTMPARIAQLADGRLALAGIDMSAGQNYDHVIVTRFLATGAPDSSFGSHGNVDFVIGSESDPHGLVEMANGTLVVSGTLNGTPEYCGGSGSSFVRGLLPNGAIDGGFASGGTLLLSGFAAEDMARDPQGRLLVGGSSCPASGGPWFGLARLQRDAPVAGPSGGGGGGTPGGAALAARLRKLVRFGSARLHGRTLLLTMSCASAAQPDCAGKLAVRRSRRAPRIGRAGFGAKPGRRRRLRVRLQRTPGRSVLLHVALRAPAKGAFDVKLRVRR